MVEKIAAIERRRRWHNYWVLAVHNLNEYQQQVDQTALAELLANHRDLPGHFAIRAR